jgi:hypothetical protein
VESAPQPAMEPVASDPPVEESAAQQPAEIEAPPAVSLRLEIDFSAREAEIALSDTSDTVRLVFDAGAWRLVSPPG